MSAQNKSIGLFLWLDLWRIWMGLKPAGMKLLAFEIGFCWHQVIGFWPLTFRNGSDRIRSAGMRLLAF